MKRLLGLIGLTGLVVLTTCFYLEKLAAILVSLFAIILFLVTLLIKKTREGKTLPVMFLTAFLAVSLFVGYTHLYINPLRDSYDNKTVTVRATRLSDCYYLNKYYCYELRCSEINGEKVNCKMLLRSKDAVFSDICDELRFTCDMQFSADNINPSNRIFLQSWAQKGHDIKVTPAQKRNVNYYVSSFRRSLSRALYLEMDYDTANFSSAVLLGDKYAINPELKNLLRVSGLSHIAVVSGLHLSIIGLIFNKFFRKLIRNRYFASALSIVVVVFFAMISGMGVSVIRALVMFCILTVGTMLGRRSDSLNSIGAAALVLTVGNPYSVGDIGMLLSFASTIGIVLWATKVYNVLARKIGMVSLFVRFKLLNKFLKSIAGIFACNLCATLWTMPITILVFKGFSLVSMIANLLIVPFISSVLLCIALCIATHFIPFFYPITNVLASIVSLFYDYMIAVLGALEALPFAYVNASKPYFVVWVVVTIALVIAAYIVKKHFMRVLCVLLSVLFLLSATFVYYYSHRDTLTLYVPFSGSGLSVVLESTDGYAVLSAHGSQSRYNEVSDVVDSMNMMGNATLVSLSGFNSEKYSRNLINEFDYNTVLRYDIGDESKDKSLCESEITFDRVHHLNLWDKVMVTLIPCEGTVFVYIESEGTKALVVPRYSDCSLLPDSYLDVDTVISQGEVKNPQLLRFSTLIAPGDGKYDDESMGYLLSEADELIRGNDITYNIELS